MQNLSGTTRRRAFISILLIAVPLGLSTACSPSSPTTVSGHVRYTGSGAPYAGVTVLFRNVYNRELHTDTDENGYYSISLPEGTYAPFAVDNHTVINAAFDLVNPTDSVVRVPPSSRVDFLATPTRSKYGG